MQFIIKAPHQKHIFPLLLLQKVTSISEPILFSSHHAPFLTLWNILIDLFKYLNIEIVFCELSLNKLINLTSVSSRLFCKCFSAIFKNTIHALYKQKYPYKAAWNVYMAKNAPPKRDHGFMTVGSLLGGRIYFHVDRFWFFNRILLLGEISLNRGPHIDGMFFLHINRLLKVL